MPGRQRRPMGITLQIRGLCAAIVSSALVIALLGLGSPAEARITQLIITTRTSPAFGGASFGDVGQYEQLDGTAVGEVDPRIRSTRSSRTSGWRPATPGATSSTR